MLSSSSARKNSMCGAESFSAGMCPARLVERAAEVDATARAFEAETLVGGY